MAAPAPDRSLIPTTRSVFFKAWKIPALPSNALTDFYTAYANERPVVGIYNQKWTLPEPPVVSYDAKLLADAKEFSDTAMVVISRVGGEGADLPRDVSQVK